MLKNRLKRIDPRCRSSLEKAIKYLEDSLGENLLGVCVVGSSTCSDWNEGSDIDLLYLTHGTPDYLKKLEMEDDLRESVDVRVQFIPMQTDFLLNYHLKNRTTMAHSIRRGVVIVDDEGLFNDFKSLTDNDLPKIEWIKEYFIKFVFVHSKGLYGIKHEKEEWKKYGEEFSPFYENNICRAIVNYSILYLELKGIIPTTKRQVIRGLNYLDFSKEVTKDVESSMYIVRDDRLMNKDEIDRFIDSARYLKSSLQHLLEISDEELKKYDIFHGDE